MARKTIMKKEPTVSVALPNSEKERLGMPTSPPVKQKLQRLSPGVYRNQQGQLTTSAGRALPRPGRQTQQGRLTDALNQTSQPGQIATRPPAPLGTPAGEAATQADDMGQNSAPLGAKPGGFPQLTPEQLQQLLSYLQRPQMQMNPMQMPNMPQGEVNTGIYGGASPNYMQSQVMPENGSQMQQPMMMPSISYNPYYRR